VRYLFVGFEVLTAVVMSLASFLDIAPCSPYMNRRFGEMYHLHLQGRKSAEQDPNVQQVAREVAACSHADCMAMHLRKWQLSGLCFFIFRE
jgi:hypothetical protein